jgi:hypothetical protein
MMRRWLAVLSFIIIYELGALLYGNARIIVIVISEVWFVLYFAGVCSEMTFLTRYV